MLYGACTNDPLLPVETNCDCTRRNNHFLGLKLLSKPSPQSHKAGDALQSLERCRFGHLCLENGVLRLGLAGVQGLWSVITMACMIMRKPHTPPAVSILAVFPCVLQSWGPTFVRRTRMASLDKPPTSKRQHACPSEIRCMQRDAHVPQSTALSRRLTFHIPQKMQDILEERMAKYARASGHPRLVELLSRHTRDQKDKATLERRRR